MALISVETKNRIKKEEEEILNTPVIPPPIKREYQKPKILRGILPKGLVKFRGAYYDFNTKNTSFLQVCKDLKGAGIKNNFFMLELHDIGLYDIDPYDPNLSPEMIQRINTECYVNPWYYLREVSRVPSQGGSPVMFKLNRATCAQIWLFLMGVDTYITIARQIGKTTSILALLAWVYLFGTSGSKFLFMHIDKERAAGNLNDMKLQIELLPIWMQQSKRYYPEKDSYKSGTNNVNKVSNIFNGNTISCTGQPKGQTDADNKARGLQQPIQFFDEFEFIDWNDIILAVAGPAFVTASENAEMNGAMFGRIFSSTAGSIDTNAGAAAQKLLQETKRWEERFYDKEFKIGVKKFRQYIKKNSKVGVVYIEYPYYLLGKGRKYHDEMAAKINDPKKFRREILLQRLRGTSNSPYDQADLDEIDGLARDPIQVDTLLGVYDLKLYEKLNPNIAYFITGDTSDGYAGKHDYTVFLILNPYTMKVAGTIRSNFMPPEDQYKVVQILARKYVKKGPIAIERNKAQVLLNQLRKSPVGYRIYSEKADEISKMTQEVTDIKGHYKRDALIRSGLGIGTTTKTRPLMFQELEYNVMYNKELFVDKDLTAELMTLVQLNSGKIVADKGCHDDMIMALNIALYLAAYGKGLAKFGFQKGKKIEELLVPGQIDYSDITMGQAIDLFNKLPEEIRSQFNIPTDASSYDKERYRNDINDLVNIRREQNPDYGYLSQEDKELIDPNFDNFDTYNPRGDRNSYNINLSRILDEEVDDELGNMYD